MAADDEDGSGTVDNGGIGGGSKVADAVAVVEAVAEAKAVAAEAAAAAAGGKPELCFETSAILTSVGSWRMMQMDLTER